MQGYNPMDDMPPAPPGVSFAPNNIPQPPPDQMGVPQPPPGPTLGQVAPAPPPAVGGLPAPPDPGTGGPVNLVDQYAQALQAARQMIAPAKEEYIHPPPMTPGHLLGNVLTFGMLGLAERDHAIRHNEKVDTYNKGLELHAATLAKDMVNSQASGSMRDLGMQLNIIRTQLAVQQAAQRNFEAAHRRSMEPLIDAPDSPAKAAQYEQLGLGPIEGDPKHWGPPGAGGGGVGGGAPGPRLPRLPGGGFGMPGPPADPNSPAGKVGLGPQGGTPAAPGTTPAPTAAGEGKRDDETWTQYAARQKAAEAQGKIDVAGATEKAKTDVALSGTIDQIRHELAPLREAAQKVLPSLGQGGIVAGTAKTYIGGPISLKKAQYSSDPKLRDAAKTLTSSARNIFNLIKAEAGGTSGLRITNAEIATFGKQFQGLASGNATIEDAQTYIDNLNDFLDRRDPRKAGTPTTTTTSSTTPSSSPPSSTGGRTTRRLSSGALIVEEP